MAAIPRCQGPGCENPLVYPEGHARAGQLKPHGTKTCSDRCRNARLRAKARKQAHRKATPPEHSDIAAATRGQIKDAAHEALKAELQPIVREAMTADVLDSIGTMVKLNKAAIKLLSLQLDSEDETIAQRAATMILKYTLGNPSVAPPPTEKAPAPMSVIFNIPRPGDETPALEPPEDVELRECTDCSTAKLPSEFVGASPRCQECFDALHETLRERFAKDDPTAPA